MYPHQRRNGHIRKTPVNINCNGNNENDDDGGGQDSTSHITSPAVVTPIHFSPTNNHDADPQRDNISGATTTTTAATTMSDDDRPYQYPDAITSHISSAASATTASFNGSSKKRIKGGTMKTAAAATAAATTTTANHQHPRKKPSSYKSLLSLHFILNSTKRDCHNDNNSSGSSNNNSSSISSRNIQFLRIIVVLCIVLYLYFLYQTQHILDRHHTLQFHPDIMILSRHHSSSSNTHPSYIVNDNTIKEHRSSLSLPSIRGGLGKPRNKLPTISTTTTTKAKKPKASNNKKRPKSNVKMLPLSVQQYAINKDLFKEVIAQQVRAVNGDNHNHNNNNHAVKSTTLQQERHVKGNVGNADVEEATDLRRRTTLITQKSQSRDPKHYVQYIQNQIKRAMKRKQKASSMTTVLSNTSTDTATTSNSTNTDRFIIFNANIGGQGIGNLISGLLSAHLFGIEFNRVVCYNPQYDHEIHFLHVFEMIDPIAKVKCPHVLQQLESNTPILSIINFQGAADECEIQNLLSSSHHPYVQIIANTYPRWPIVPDYFFFYYYQPKSVLYNSLPYKEQPTTVIHLRQPDNSGDIRNGLDTPSLQALEQLVPKDPSTFLVTNNVDFYSRFDKCCHWSHPQWDVIQHSALQDVWGVGRKTKSLNKEQQRVQMWVDWYTILMADVVYHTHSDFSISAIHWMNQRHSHSIKGYNHQTHHLETTPESYISDGETIPLVNRTVHGIPTIPNSELRACKLHTLQETVHREEQNKQTTI